MDWLVFLSVAIAVCIGYAIGACQWWRWGRKYGEADGIAWATERLRRESEQLVQKRLDDPT